MSSTQLWFDLETTGIDPQYDRIFQFAAVRTDLQLNPLAEPLTLYCHPACDYVPNPEACLKTGLTPQHVRSKGLPEYRFAAELYRQFSVPETCSSGFNTINFDDNFIRFLFYRNFYDPYDREWKHGNSRWDILDLMRMCRALRPEGLNWPNDAKGAPLFNLLSLCEANQIVCDNPHEAMSDVLATVELARLVLKHQPKLYRYAFKLRHREEVLKILNPEAENAGAVVYTTRFADREQCYTQLVLPLCRESSNRNSILAADLGSDPELLTGADSAALEEAMSSGAALHQLGLFRIQCNKVPMVSPAAALREADAVRLNIDLDACEKHRRQLQADSDLPDRLLQASENAPPRSAAKDADRALYDGFIPDSDRQTRDKIPAMSPSQLAAAQIKFSDWRLNELLFRYRARNFSDSLSEEEKIRWQDWCYRKLTDPELAGQRTLENYMDTIQVLDDALEAQGDKNQVLQQLHEWTDELLA